MLSINDNTKIQDGVYFITGITGFIGSVLTKYLLESQQYKNGNIKIIGLVRNIEKAVHMYSSFECSNLQFIKGDLLELNKVFLQENGIYNNIDYIFHCAATTKSSDMILCPVETSEGIVMGSKNVLDIAKNFKVKSMIYISSMEIYGVVEENRKKIDENQLGSIDILSARSSYSLGKRMAENFCYSYYKEYGVPVKIARLAQTFGTGILPSETRVFAQFARCALNGEDIVLHTKGDSFGNYVESSDACRALFLLLGKGSEGEAYNIANESNTMTIFEMAKLVADKIAGGKIKVIFDIPKNNVYGYAEKTGLRLSSSKIRNLGWIPKYGMEDMYKKIIYDIEN